MTDDSQPLIALPSSEPASNTVARLFLAIWPDPLQQALLANHRDHWRWPAGSTPVRDDRLHLTLHFIGAVERQRIDALADGLALPLTPCRLSLTRTEVWSNGIAALRAEAIPPALADLHRRLGQALRALAVPVETRRFHPHVTLGRRASGASPPRDRTDLVWEIDHYVLVESQRISGGGYHICRRYVAVNRES